MSIYENSACSVFGKLAIFEIGRKMTNYRAYTTVNEQQNVY